MYAAHSLGAGKTTNAADPPAKQSRIALVLLQGGSALGAYQAGVYKALHDAGLEPDVSIGGIDAAIIARNPPEASGCPAARVLDPRDLAPGMDGEIPGGDTIRNLHNAWSSMMTGSFGQPGFFKPRSSNPWLAGRGSGDSTSASSVRCSGR